MHKIEKQVNTRPGYTLKNYDSVPRHKKEIDNMRVLLNELGRKISSLEVRKSE